MKKQRLGFDLILLGAPASGKDTQARLLERRFALKPVESGKYFRSLASKKTKTGNMLSNNFAKGKPAPVKMMKEFLSASLRFPPKEADWIFVGNPRLKPEAEFLAKKLSELHRDYFVLFIDLPNPEIWSRSAKRRRDIVDLQYVRARIDYHKKQVSKTLGYFKKLNKLARIDGHQTIGRVNQKIMAAINDYKKSRRTK